ncbi:hypothetical protein [Ilumatobacter coccineus]|uniref:Uncharacterized protein n=1 Tax=Ilumatobacter coccineus (strain NBRC 103263 / KCTC 29153 / YM16-304) TaxID=1313172 RepID=A0A6C7E7G2_ILUCY|nr:hypothetical protein [Ilumatobacter coccineus]BAN02677.1 hypothetical protein YM304_23630 [Ilumatobacter coccineus YM16-304]
MTPFEQAPRPDIADRPTDFDFMAPGAWLEFNCELYAIVDELAIAIDRIDAGVIHLQSGRALPLLQLAQHCHLSPRDDWHDLIRQHLRTVTAHLTEVATLSAEPISMIDLRVRLVPDDPADRPVIDELCARPFADGIVQVLAVDIPDAIRLVPRCEIDELGWDLDEVWSSAWAQTEALEQPDEVNVIDVGGADVVHIFGHRVFNASLVRQIEDVVGTIGPNGAIVSIPHNHSVLVHVIEDTTVVTALNAMIPITRQVHRHGPGSVSPQLYWWRDGAMTSIPTYFAPDGVEVYPSPELVAILRALH